jgi:hypothetical protein
MKKLVLISVIGLFATSSMWGAACVLSGNTATAASFMSNAVTGLGNGVNYNGGAGCTVNGYNVSNFTLDNYIDNGYGGSGAYNFLTTGGNPANDANYLLTFGTASGGSGLSVTLTGAVTQGDGLAPWTISTSVPGLNFANPLLGFELKYTISDATKQIAGFKVVTAAENGVTVKLNSTTTTQNSAEFDKFTTGPGINVNLDTMITSPTVNGSASLTGGVTLSATSVAVTDNLFMRLHQTAGDGSLITVSSLVNVFDPAPEPMTMALMGLGLAGLAMIRRRATKN